MYTAQVIIKLVIHIFVNNPKSLVVDMRILGAAENREKQCMKHKATKKKKQGSK
jgi:hypothetical protein